MKAAALVLALSVGCATLPAPAVREQANDIREDLNAISDRASDLRVPQRALCALAKGEDALVVCDRFDTGWAAFVTAWDFAWYLTDAAELAGGDATDALDRQVETLRAGVDAMADAWQTVRDEVAK